MYSAKKLSWARPAYDEQEDISSANAEGLAAIGTFDGHIGDGPLSDIKS